MYRIVQKIGVLVVELTQILSMKQQEIKWRTLVFFRMEVYHDMNVEVCKYYLSPAWDIDRWWQQWSDFRSGKLRLSWVLRLKS